VHFATCSKFLAAVLWLAAVGGGSERLEDSVGAAAECWKRDSEMRREEERPGSPACSASTGSAIQAGSYR
jgi:hypothetical protein